MVTSTAAGVVPELALYLSHGASFCRRIVQFSGVLAAAVTSSRCTVDELCARLGRRAAGDSVTDVTALGGSMMKSTGIRTSGVPGARITSVAEYLPTSRSVGSTRMR